MALLPAGLGHRVAGESAAGIGAGYAPTQEEYTNSDRTVCAIIRNSLVVASKLPPVEVDGDFYCNFFYEENGNHSRFVRYEDTSLPHDSNWMKCSFSGVYDHNVQGSFNNFVIATMGKLFAIAVATSLDISDYSFPDNWSQPAQPPLDLCGPRKARILPNEITDDRILEIWKQLLQGQKIEGFVVSYDFSRMLARQYVPVTGDLQVFEPIPLSDAGRYQKGDYVVVRRKDKSQAIGQIAIMTLDQLGQLYCEVTLGKDVGYKQFTSKGFLKECVLSVFRL